MFVLLVRFPVNSRLFVVKLWECQMLYAEFLTQWGSPNIIQKVNYLKGDCKVSNEGRVFVFIFILLWISTFLHFGQKMCSFMNSAFRPLFEMFSVAWYIISFWWVFHVDFTIKYYLFLHVKSRFWFDRKQQNSVKQLSFN